MPGAFGNRLLRRRLRGGKIAGFAGTGSKMAGFAGTGRMKPFGRGLLGVGIPLVAALIRDLRKPDGYLRTLLDRFPKRKPAIRVVDADYERIEDNRKKIEER